MKLVISGCVSWFCTDSGLSFHMITWFDVLHFHCGSNGLPSTIKLLTQYCVHPPNDLRNISTHYFICPIYLLQPLSWLLNPYFHFFCCRTDIPQKLGLQISQHTNTTCSVKPVTCCLAQLCSALALLNQNWHHGNYLIRHELIRSLQVCSQGWPKE